MRPLLRSKVAPVKTLLLSKAMSLTPKQILSGARWDYFIAGPLQGDGTYQSTVFKAEVLPRDGSSSDVPKW
jgi:hypothetical protein